MTHRADGISHLTFLESVLFMESKNNTARSTGELFTQEAQASSDGHRFPAGTLALTEGQGNPVKRGTPTGKIRFFCKKFLSPCQCLTECPDI